MSLTYWEVRPGGGLGRQVRRLWALQGTLPPGTAFEPILPDGCPELVFNLADPFERPGPETIERQPLVLLAGQMVGPLAVRPTGIVDLVGIRFWPWGARRVAAVSPHGLVDRIVSGDAVNGLAGLRDRLPLIPRLDHRLRRLEEWLEPTLGTMTAPPAAIEAIGVGRVTSVSSAARGAGISPRHLERLSLEWVGLPPGQLIRLLRFQRMLRSLRQPSCVSLARLAVELGFADQAHLTREFRRYSGMTPTAVRAGVGALTESFIEPGAA